jgi:hypothetical protein
MTPDQFKKWCPGLWHVAPAGAWEQIREQGFKTAAQLIVDAGDDPAAPPARRRNVDDFGGDEAASKWVDHLNSRVYLFASRAPMDKMLAKYTAADGAQDVLILSTQRLLDAVRPAMQLSSQNSSAITRVPAPEKAAEMFVSLARFPDKRPAEVTVVDGFDAKGIVIRAERHYADGHYEVLAV